MEHSMAAISVYVLMRVSGVASMRARCRWHVEGLKIGDSEQPRSTEGQLGRLLTAEVIVSYKTVL